MKTFEEHWDEQLEKKKLDEEWHKEYKKECKKAKKRKIKEAHHQLGISFQYYTQCTFKLHTHLSFVEHLFKLYTQCTFKLSRPMYT